MWIILHEATRRQESFELWKLLSLKSIAPNLLQEMLQQNPQKAISSDYTTLKSIIEIIFGEADVFTIRHGCA